MPGSWDLDLGGTRHTVTVERAENGKDMVRVDGRVAAKPMAPEEEERVLTIAGYSYMLRRSGADTFTLDTDPQEEAIARNFEAAQFALAHSKTAPVGLASPRFNPLTLAWVLLIVPVMLVMLMLRPPSYEKVARARVHAMLFEMKSGNWMMMQTAITLWARNVRMMDNTSLSAASDAFDKWRDKGGLMNRKFDQFEITDSKVDKAATVPTAIIKFSLDGGKEYTVRVPDKAPIEWEN